MAVAPFPELCMRELILYPGATESIFSFVASSPSSSMGTPAPGGFSWCKGEWDHFTLLSPQSPNTLSISFLSSKECFKFVGFWKANTKIHTFVFFCLNLPFDFQKTVKYFKHTSRKIIKNNIESIQLSTT